MTDDQNIVTVRRELSAGAIGDGNVVEKDARFEGEFGNDGNVLMGNEGGKRVLGLTIGSLYGI